MDESQFLSFCNDGELQKLIKNAQNTGSVFHRSCPLYGESIND
jgi:hypothetical protein